MSRITSLPAVPTVHREPVAIINAVIGVLETGIALLVAFGLDLTPNQIGAVMAFVIASATLTKTLWARNLVTPVASPCNNKGQRLEPVDSV